MMACEEIKKVRQSVVEGPVFSVDSPRAKNVLACEKYMLSFTSDAQYKGSLRTFTPLSGTLWKV